MLQDGEGAAHLYDMDAQALVEPPGFQGELASAVWHPEDPHLLVLSSDAGGPGLHARCACSAGRRCAWGSVDMAMEAALEQLGEACLCRPAGDLFCYVYVAASVEGSGLKLLGRQSKPHGAAPLARRGGCLVCRQQGGSHVEVQLQAFAPLREVCQARM